MRAIESVRLAVAARSGTRESSCTFGWNSHEFLYSFAVLLAACALVGCSSDLDLHTAMAADAVPARAAAPDAPPTVGNDRYLGLSTCASAGCHGFSGAGSASAGQASDAHESAWRTAYWKWASDDPHAQAYDVLWRPRSPDAPNSQNIVRQLDPQAVKDKKRYSEFLLKNCCGCHATGVASRVSSEGTAGADRPPESLTSGVHCEACHGPARDWVKEHTLEPWVSRPQAQQEAAGHRTTRDLTVRATICVKCHVGSTETPGQEVNHDLIAAGHPRLFFEYTVFLARMPPHWDEQRDRKWAERPAPRQGVAGRPRTNFELEAWHAGQLVSARQALRLLAGRAQRAANGDDRPWPELSEFDCFACHHELNPSGFRQKSKSDGVLVWTNWYTALSDHWLPPTGGSRDSLAELQSLLEEQPPPQPQKVFQAADNVSGQLAALLDSRPVFATPAGRARLVKALASEKLPEPGWMEATQWMLAVTASVQAFDPAQVEAHAPGLESRLEALEDRLAFAPALADEAPDAAKFPAQKIINSPRTFDPADPGYRLLITQIREDLKKLAGAAIPQNPEAER